jgi:PAS domain S-box-containing protein
MGFFTEGRKRSNTALSSEGLFTDAFEQAAVGMCHVSLKGEFVQVNKKLCGILGYSKDELKKLSFSDITFPEDLSKSVEGMQSLLDGDMPYLTFEKRYVCKDGSVMWASVSSSVIRDKKHKPLYLNTVIQDISSRKEMEKQVDTSNTSFKMLYENIDEGVALHKLVFKDSKPSDYIIVDVNPKYEQIVNLKREDVIGKLATKVYKSDASPYIEEYGKVVISGVPYHFTTYFAPMDKHFSVSAAPWGKDGFSTIFSDITEQVKAKRRRERGSILCGSES